MATLKDFTKFVGVADDLKKAQYEAVMAVAKEKGFEKEAKAAVAKVVIDCAEKCGVELSPEELQKVAGGHVFEASWWEYNLGCDSKWTIF